MLAHWGGSWLYALMALLCLVILMLYGLSGPRAQHWSGRILMVRGQHLVGSQVHWASKGRVPISMPPKG